MREDAAGTGTSVDRGACYLDADCATKPRPMTAFPLGAVNAEGKEWCPMCPRPGIPLADEGDRSQRLAASCPHNQCAPEVAPTCERRTCEFGPARARRQPVLAIVDPVEPPFPPEVPPLPDDADHRCSAAAQCVVLEACCGQKQVVARSAAKKYSQPCNAPCAHQRDPPPAEVCVPVCFERLCMKQSLQHEVQAARRARALTLPAFSEWAREVAALKAQRARLAEVELVAPAQ